MLKIRGAQLQAFEHQLHEQQAVELEAFLREHFAPECRWAENNAQALVCHARAAGARYGLASSYELSGYLELMLQLGSGFDSDPCLPWATALLNDPGLTSAGLRAGPYDGDTRWRRGRPDRLHGRALLRHPFAT